MGKIEFANCQDVRNQKKIRELDCPRCHEPGGIEAFVKDGEYLQRTEYVITADIFFRKEQNWRKWSKKHLRRYLM